MIMVLLAPCSISIALEHTLHVEPEDHMSCISTAQNISEQMKEIVPCDPLSLNPARHTLATYHFQPALYDPSHPRDFRLAPSRGTWSSTTQATELLPLGRNGV